MGPPAGRKAGRKAERSCSAGIRVTHDGEAAAPGAKNGRDKTGHDKTGHDKNGRDTNAARLHLVMADRLAPDRMVLAGWLADPRSQVARVSVGAGTDADIDLMAHAVLLADRRAHRAFGAPPDVPVRFAFVALLAQPGADRTDGLRLRLHRRSGETIAAVLPAVGDASRLPDMLEDASADDALRVAGHLLGGWRRDDDRAPHLPRMLETLAEQAHRRIDPGRDHGTAIGAPPAACFIDGAIRVGSAGILVRGWLLHDDGDTVQQVALVGLSGRRVKLDSPLPAIARPDVLEAKPAGIASRNAHCGFVAFAAIDGLRRDDTLWFLEAAMRGGAVARAPFVCPPEPEPLAGIAATVALAEPAACDPADLFARALAPALERFWSRTRQNRSAPAELVHGAPAAGAQVSVIVPLYGRIDFLRHQIARISNDPAFRGDGGIVDLIYVLDDPAQADALRQLARLVHGVYGVPFRVLLQHRNLGYAAATNAGAATARGPLLLLLNSDVVPRTPGWIGKLARRYRALDRCGVLGCRLLFEDETIQHAGMTFQESPMLKGCWSTQHPGKGLPASFDADAGARPVPAVTGACMMIDRFLFDDLGGLSEDYVIGDFEDSDLCLKAYDHGFRSYYTPEVALYHLERQSMRLINNGDAGWRQSLTLYNMWRHARRWGHLIPRVLAELEPPPPAPAWNDRFPRRMEIIDAAVG